MTPMEKSKITRTKVICKTIKHLVSELTNKFCNYADGVCIRETIKSLTESLAKIQES